MLDIAKYFESTSDNQTPLIGPCIHIMTICKDKTTQIFDLDRFEFITDGKLAIRRNDTIPPDINAMPLEAHPLP